MLGVQRMNAQRLRHRLHARSHASGVQGPGPNAAAGVRCFRGAGKHSHRAPRVRAQVWGREGGDQTQPLSARKGRGGYSTYLYRECLARPEARPRADKHAYQSLPRGIHKRYSPGRGAKHSQTVATFGWARDDGTARNGTPQGKGSQEGTGTRKVFTNVTLPEGGSIHKRWRPSKQRGPSSGPPKSMRLVRITTFVVMEE